MDYKEKYEQGLECLEEILSSGQEKIKMTLLKERLLPFFPELESEDERMKKKCINFLNLHKRYRASSAEIDECIAWLEKQEGCKQKNKINSYKITFKDVLALECAMKTVKITEGGDKLYEILVPLYNKIHNAYLAEKQGEQKVPINDFKAKNWYVSEVDGKIHDMTYNPTDKVEPKFKVGDWIANDYCTGKVIALTDDAYLLDSGQGIPFSCEHNTHLWTIQDAKDGDVLVDVYGNIGIFQKNDDFDWSSYCSLGPNGGFRCFAIEHELDGSHPATKEQYDTLFKAMTEAGYTWDMKKKKSKLLISNGGDFESNNSKQKSTWSDEDERLRNSCIKHIEEELEEIRKDKFGHSEIISDLKESCRERINWLKSLKKDWIEKQGEQKSKEEIKTTAYDTSNSDVIEYVYILDYSTGRIIVARHDVEESISELFKQLGLKENQCHYMVSDKILSIEYINF